MKLNQSEMYWVCYSVTVNTKARMGHDSFCHLFWKDSWSKNGNSAVDSFCQKKPNELNQKIKHFNFFLEINKNQPNIN